MVKLGADKGPSITFFTKVPSKREVLPRVSRLRKAVAGVNQRLVETTDLWSPCLNGKMAKFVHESYSKLEVVG
jgi:hypothetical protein